MANMGYRAKGCADRSNRCGDMAIFRFFQFSDFYHFTFFNGRNGQVGRTVSRIPNFVEIAQTAAEIRRVDFSRWLPPPSWNFEISNLLTIGCVKSVELRHQSKFRSHRSNRCRDMMIFRFFQDGDHPPS